MCNSLKCAAIFSSVMNCFVCLVSNRSGPSSFLFWWITGSKLGPPVNLTNSVCWRDGTLHGIDIGGTWGICIHGPDCCEVLCWPIICWNIDGGVWRFDPPIAFVIWSHLEQDGTCFGLRVVRRDEQVLPRNFTKAFVLCNARFWHRVLGNRKKKKETMHEHVSRQSSHNISDPWTICQTLTSIALTCRAVSRVRKCSYASVLRHAKRALNVIKDLECYTRRYIYLYIAALWFSYGPPFENDRVRTDCFRLSRCHWIDTTSVYNVEKFQLK